MAAFRLITALEIYSNPHDLEFSIFLGPDGKYGLLITRGPGHNFKRMISSTPFADTPEKAIEIVENILKISRKAIISEFEDSGSFLVRTFHPDLQTVDESKVLSEKLIEQILGDLRQHQVASTYKMNVTAGT